MGTTIIIVELPFTTFVGSSLCFTSISICLLSTSKYFSKISPTHLYSSIENPPVSGRETVPARVVCPIQWVLTIQYTTDIRKNQSFPVRFIYSSIVDILLKHPTILTKTAIDHSFSQKLSLQSFLHGQPNLNSIK